MTTVPPASNVESAEPTIRVRCYFKREQGEIIHRDSPDARRSAIALYQLCAEKYGDLRVEVLRRVEDDLLLLVVSFVFALDAKKLVTSFQDPVWKDTKKWFGFSLVKLDYLPVLGFFSPASLFVCACV